MIQIGYARTLLNSLGITMLLLTVGALFMLGDRRLSRREHRHDRERSVLP